MASPAAAGNTDPQNPGSLANLATGPAGRANPADATASPANPADATATPAGATPAAEGPSGSKDPVVPATYAPTASARPRLVLASASPARLATLRAAGLDPVVRVSGVDETALLARILGAHPDAAPASRVLGLARGKARDVADGLREAGEGHGLVLGCDSMLELDGEVVGKPSGAAEAVRRIRQQSGRTAVLHTGHWLIDLAAPDGPREVRRFDRLGPASRPIPAPTGAAPTADAAPCVATHIGMKPGEAGGVSSTVVRFADLTDAEIDAYVATGEPLHVAGAFTIDGLGGPFVAGLDGDPHGVVGLSLPLLRTLLGRLGRTIPELWAPAPSA